MSTEQRWAAKHLLAELAEIREVGFACNVQEWTHVGRKNERECERRRREARRLLTLAMQAINKAAR